MDPELKSKWIEALKSGDYLQTQGRLYAGDDLENGKPCMCCLGVLEAVCGTNKYEMEYKEMPSDLTDSKSPADVLMQLVPVTVVVSESLGSKLAGMNDSGKSFDEIADYIKENL